MSLILDGTSGLSDVDGTAGTPAIRGSDANTGVFFGTDIVGVSTGGSERVRVDASGNVGIGTSSPNTKLHITGNLTIENSSNSPFINFVESGDNTDVKARIEMDQVSGTAGNLLFYTEGGGTLAERARIDSSGNLLVGATSGYSDVSIFALAQGGSKVAFGTKNTAAGSVNYAFICRNTTNTTVGSIQANDTSTSYVTSSDYRLKENIAPMTGALAKVAALKPVTYTWKSTGETDEGFIAHELQEVCPSAVTGEKDAVDADGNPQYQGIDTSFLVATLTAAIQELKAINDAQAQTIESLTARVVALEGQA
jgi:hypothetical protein